MTIALFIETDIDIEKAALFDLIQEASKPVPGITGDEALSASVVIMRQNGSSIMAWSKIGFNLDEEGVHLTLGQPIPMLPRFQDAKVRTYPSVVNTLD